MLVQQLRTAQFDWSVLTRQSDGAQTGILKSDLDPYIDLSALPLCVLSTQLGPGIDVFM